MRVRGMTKVAVAAAVLVCACAGWGCDLLGSGEPDEPGAESERGAAASEDEGDDSDEADPQARSEAFRVGHAKSLDEAMLRWRGLWRKDAGDDVVIAEGGDGWIFVARGEEATEAAARVLEHEPEAMEVPTNPLEPTMLATTTSLNVRDAPDGSADLVRTLPEGTVVVAVHGSVDDETSEPGGSGHWTRALATRNDEGWSSSKFLEAYDGCLPLPGRLLADVPKGRRAAARTDVTYTAVDITKKRKKSEGFMLIARDPEKSRSYVGVYRADAKCSLKDESPTEIGGFVEEAFLIDSAAQGGESLLVVGWHREPELGKDGKVTWSVFRIGDSRPFWERELATGLNLPRRKRDRIDGNVRTRVDGEPVFAPLAITLADGTKELLRLEGRSFVEIGQQGSADEPGSD